MFQTKSGIAVTSVTREQMIEIDRLALENTGPNLFQMMENAGRNLAEFCINYLGKDWQEKEIIVMAGKGNNGGGGICAARHLINHSGKVKLIIANSSNINPTVSYQKMIYNNAGGNILSFDSKLNEKPHLIIDALIGYNLKKEPVGQVKEIINWANSSRNKIISLDIPSGIDANTGLARGIFIEADATITLALPKVGLQKMKFGKIYLADIGIPKATFEMVGLSYTSPYNNKYVVQLEWK